MTMKRYTILGMAVLGLALLPGHGFLAAEGQAYLGVFLSPLPEALSDQVGADGGVMLGDVLAGSPAEKTGLRRHDIVTAAGGTGVAGPDALRDIIQARKPGDTLRLDVRRGKETLAVDVVLGEAPARPHAGEKPEKPRKTERSDSQARPGFLGIGFAEVDPALASHLGLEAGTGVLVGSVWKDSPAAKAAIEKNDVLVSVDGHALEGAQGILRLLGEKRPGETVKLEVIHKGQRRTVEAVLAERPHELEGQGARSRFPLGFPGLSNRGRITIERPDGSQESFDLSNEGWDPDELFRQFEDRFKGLRGFLGSEEMNERLRKMLEDMDAGGLPAEGSSFQSRSAVVRIVDGDHDITIRDQDGARTVTVKQGDKVIAEDLPFDKLDTLPEDARKRVEKAAESLEEARPARPVELLPPAGERKIKA
jgi:membrane-associated protease RseP (regulator of RpoE activity)